VQEAVFEAGRLYLDEVGELEAPLERTCGNAAVDEAPVSALRCLVALDRQQVLLRDDIDLVWRESGCGDRYAVTILALLLEVERRKAVRRVRCGLRLEKVKETVKANRRAAIRRQV